MNGIHTNPIVTFTIFLDLPVKLFTFALSKKERKKKSKKKGTKMKEKKMLDDNGQI